MNNDLTCEVSIDIDVDDDDDEVEEEKVEPKNDTEETIQNEDIDDDIMIDKPLSVDEVQCHLNEKIRINQLSTELSNIITIGLNSPSFLTISNWIGVANYFRMLPNEISMFESDPRPAEKLLAQYGESPALYLFNALKHIRRVDILFQIQKIICTKSIVDYLRPADSSPPSTHSLGSASTARASDVMSSMPNHTVSISSRPRRKDYSKTILINHHETTKEEKDDYKWFKLNLKKILKEKGSEYKVMDAEKFEDDDGGNIQMKIVEVYNEVPHMIVCFNKSYLNLLSSEEYNAARNYKKFIHQQSNQEFYAKDSRNIRCRAVLMRGTLNTELTGWSSVTHPYRFPEDFDSFMTRLLKKPKKSQLTTM